MELRHAYEALVEVLDSIFSVLWRGISNIADSTVRNDFDIGDCVELREVRTKVFLRQADRKVSHKYPRSRHCGLFHIIMACKCKFGRA